mgnify:CR=1 FL=1
MNLQNISREKDETRLVVDRDKPVNLEFVYSDFGLWLNMDIGLLLWTKDMLYIERLSDIIRSLSVWKSVLLPTVFYIESILTFLKTGAYCYC